MTISQDAHPHPVARKDESWFQGLVEQASIAVFGYQAGLLYANPIAEGLTGYTADELRHLDPSSLLLRGHRFAALRLGQRLLQKGLPFRREIAFRSKQGEERWLDVSALPFEVEGQPMLLATAVDITDRRQTFSRLEESERWFRAVADTTTASIFVYDAERFLYTNRAGELLTGYTADEILRMSPERITHPDDQEKLRKRMAQRLRGEVIAPLPFDLRIITRDRSVRHLSITASSLETQGRRAVLGTAVDITERKLAEEALHREKEHAQVTLASIGDGVIRTDTQGRIDYLNPVAERLTGWSMEDARGRPLMEVFHLVDEVTRKTIPSPVETCLREGRVMELPSYAVLVRRDGAEFSIRDSVAPLRDRSDSIMGAVLVFKDLSEIRGLEREMTYLAEHDPLTSLLNRREFERQLHAALEGARSGSKAHALCYLDLEEFQVINDTCGHLAGDEVLKQASKLMEDALRSEDVLARLGSDEFGILLLDTGMGEARQIAQTLLESITGLHFEWHSHVFELGVSIGLVPVSTEMLDTGEVLRAADAACHVAREQGRNRIHEYRPDDRAVAERHGQMQWISRIHRALAENQFELFYQPILPTQPRPSAAPLCEVFIRMRDDQGGIIAPSAFISAAERYHLVSAIDRWVVETALRTFSSSSRVDGRFALNLSGQSVGDEAFLEFVLRQIEESGIDPSRISFEITETAAIANLARATRFMSLLRSQGCTFVLDDFGSGLSSFGYLKNLPVDFLKIDGEFVRDLPGSRVQYALVKSINQLGHDMGIETIAESVETEAAFEAVRDLGVDFAQGYWIERPRPLTG